MPDDKNVQGKVEAKPPSASSSRIASIDALRGFDMFWIVGAASLVSALNHMSPSPLTKFLAYELGHAQWEGFHFYDLIFPLFVFIVGLVLPFSITRRLEAGADRRQLYMHAFRRLGLLLLLGSLAGTWAREGR